MLHGIDTSFLAAVEISAHPEHLASRNTAQRVKGAGDPFALIPQVLAESLHIVTDGRRFSRPLNMDVALERMLHWWEEVEYRVAIQETVLD